MRHVFLLFLLAALLSCRKPATPQSGGASTDGRIKVISTGNAIDKLDYLVADSVVILDFYADW